MADMHAKSVVAAAILLICPVATLGQPCPDGWIWNYDFGRCYYSLEGAPNALTWNEANERCKDLDPKATLASVHSEEENFFILTLNQFPAKWIGGTDAAEEGIWRWVDDNSLVDDIFSYTNWASNAPTVNEDRNCIYFLSDGLWSDMDCNFTTFAVCSKSICPEGLWNWNPDFGKCYHIIEGAPNMVTWNEANEKCKDLDPEATLTSVHSEEENLYIRGSAGGSTYIPIWLGGTDAAEEGVWRWVDDNSLLNDSYTNWSEGYPTENEDSNCILLNLNLGTWGDFDCNEPEYAACSKRIVT